MLMPRLDRLATLYLFNPFSNRFKGSGESRVPILMYHSVSEKRDDAKAAYYQTTTTPPVFEAQMRLLHENNYSVIGLDEVEGHLHGFRAALRPIVLTFDDGYADFHENAYPVLKRYGYRATVFISTDFVENHPKKMNNRVCLDRETVKYLSREGISFGSHTVHHPQLEYLDMKQIDYEIRKSKEAIELMLGKEVSSFSYPFAFPEHDLGFTARLRSMLRDCGYKNGVSTIIGTADRTDDILFLKRLPVNLHDDECLLKAKLNGGYDWLHELQYLAKQLKSRVN